MPIRILSWNIKNFGTRHNVNPPQQVILDTVNPVGGANYDVFVIIEPKLDKSLSVGDFATGTGKTATWALRTALRAQSAVEWEVVPPINLGNGDGRNEAITVFYNADLLHLEGPEHIVHALPWRWHTVGGGGGANRGTARAAGGTYTGRWGWAVGGGQLEFPDAGERRPYLVQFQEVASGLSFLLIAAHSPSPGPKSSPPGKKNRFAIEGTRRLGVIPEASTGRVLPVVTMGDFNTCSRPNCTDFKFANNTGAVDTMAGIGAQLFAEGAFSSVITYVNDRRALAHAASVSTAAALAALPPQDDEAVRFALWAGKNGVAVVHTCNDLPGVPVDLVDAVDTARRDCRIGDGLVAANAQARATALVTAIDNLILALPHVGVLAGDRVESLSIRTRVYQALISEAAAFSLTHATTAEEAHWALAAAALGRALDDKADAAIVAGLADPAVGAERLNLDAAVSAAGVANPLAPVGDGALAANIETQVDALDTAVSALVKPAYISALSVLEAMVRSLDVLAARAVAVTGTQDAIRFALVAGRLGNLAADAAADGAVVGAVNTAIVNLQTSTAACVPPTLTLLNAHTSAQLVATRATALLAATNAMALAGPREELCRASQPAAPASPRVRVELLLEISTWANGIAQGAPNTNSARRHAWIAGLAARHAVFTAAGIAGAATQLGDAALASELALEANNAGGAAAALAARNALTALLGRIYRTHIFETRTSLRKGEAMFRKVKGVHSSYTSHAYDHMLTVGFTGVSNPRFADLFLTRFPDMATIAHGTSKQIKRWFDDDFRTAFNTVYGTSDHLPISIEVTP